MIIEILKNENKKTNKENLKAEENKTYLKIWKRSEPKDKPHPILANSNWSGTA